MLTWLSLVALPRSVTASPGAMDDAQEPGPSLPGDGALAQAPAGADMEEALELDVPELAGLAGEDSGSDELCEEAPPPTARVAAEARIGAKRRPLSHLTRLEFLTDLVRPCPALVVPLASPHGRVCAYVQLASHPGCLPCAPVSRSTSCARTETATWSPQQVRPERLRGGRPPRECAALEWQAAAGEKAGGRLTDAVATPPALSLTHSSQQRAPTPTGSLRRSSTGGSWICSRCTARCAAGLWRARRESRMSPHPRSQTARPPQVVSRGGFYIRSGNRHPFSWSGDIFPNMKVRPRFGGVLQCKGN